MPDRTDNTTPPRPRRDGPAGRRPPQRRDQSSGPGRRPVSLLPARTVPLDPDGQRRAVAALAELLAAHILDHPPPAEENEGCPQAGQRGLDGGSHRG